jgi:hypothetical protein
LERRETLQKGAFPVENPNKGFSSTGGAGACLFVLAPWNASMVLVFTYVCLPEFTVTFG